MAQNKDRLYLDLVKGTAIILMLWGHCIQQCAKGSFDYFENPVFRTIYSVHMPLFMLVSGYLFFFSCQKRDLKTLLIHRTQGMLQPIVFATIFNNLLIMLPTLLLHGTMDILDGKLLAGAYALWFLFSVLAASVAVAIACKVTANPWLQLLFSVVGIVLPALFQDCHLHIFMYPFFVVGFFYGMYRRRIPAWVHKLRYLSLPLFPLLMGFYERKHYIYLTPVFAEGMTVEDMISINGLRWMIGLVGSVFALTVLKFLHDAALRKARIPRVINMVAKLGENSLAIYCLSVSLLSYYLPKVYDRFLLMAGRNVFAENMTVYNFVFTPALTVAYCFGLYGAVQLLKKWKLHSLIFGR